MGRRFRGIPTREAFGLARMSRNELLSPSAIATAQALGIPYLVKGTQLVFPASVALSYGIGAPRLTRPVQPSSIASGYASGSHSASIWTPASWPLTGWWRANYANGGEADTWPGSASAGSSGSRNLTYVAASDTKPSLGSAITGVNLTNVSTQRFPALYSRATKHTLRGPLLKDLWHMGNGSTNAFSAGFFWALFRCDTLVPTVGASTPNYQSKGPMLVSSPNFNVTVFRYPSDITKATVLPVMSPGNGENISNTAPTASTQSAFAEREPVNFASGYRLLVCWFSGGSLFSSIDGGAASSPVQQMGGGCVGNGNIMLGSFYSGSQSSAARTDSFFDGPIQEAGFCNDLTKLEEDGYTGTTPNAIQKLRRYINWAYGLTLTP